MSSKKKSRTYQMWLTWNSEKQKIQLPVNPEQLTVTCGSNNETVNIADLGGITVMQGSPPTEYSFSSFFPATEFPGLQVDSLTDPLTLIQKILKWKASDRPVHFICTATGIDEYCTIENFTYYEAGGDPGTYQYSITLREYREINIRQIVVEIPTATATVTEEPARVDNAAVPETYTVQSGDCLYSIARQFYGQGELYTIIYNANIAVIGSNPNLIYPGQVLTIPAAA